MVLPLGLQILVENCIHHNIIEDERPLSISISEENNYIVVKNNTQKKTSVRTNNNGIGLDNLKKRYTYITNQEVIIDESENYFSVSIPLIENPEA